MKPNFEAWTPPKVNRAMLDARQAKRERQLSIALTLLAVVLTAAVSVLSLPLIGALFPALLPLLLPALLLSGLSGVVVMVVYLLTRRSASYGNA